MLIVDEPLVLKERCPADARDRGDENNMIAAAVALAKILEGVGLRPMRIVDSNSLLVDACDFVERIPSEYFVVDSSAQRAEDCGETSVAFCRWLESFGVKASPPPQRGGKGACRTCGALFPLDGSDPKALGHSLAAGLYRYLGNTIRREVQRPELGRLMDWKGGDSVIAGFTKTGTNWLQNVIHQLRTGGDSTFTNIRHVVPAFGTQWPSKTAQEELDYFKSLPGPRVFKTHYVPPLVPVLPCVKYVIIVRDVFDIPISYLNFFGSFCDQARQHFGTPRYRNVRHLMNEMNDFDMFFVFLKQWLPFASYPNVLFLHFADLKRDLASHLLLLADFLEMPVPKTRESLDRVLEHSSFAWMKRHSDKFEKLADDSPLLDADAAFVRDGQIGQNSKSLPADLKIKIQNNLDRFFPNQPDIQRWIAHGGTLPLL